LAKLYPRFCEYPVHESVRPAGGRGQRADALPFAVALDQVLGERLPLGANDPTALLRAGGAGGCHVCNPHVPDIAVWYRYAGSSPHLSGPPTNDHAPNIIFAPTDTLLCVGNPTSRSRRPVPGVIRAGESGQLDEVEQV